MSAIGVWSGGGRVGAVAELFCVTAVYIDIPFNRFSKKMDCSSLLARTTQNQTNLADSALLFHSLEYVASPLLHDKLHLSTKLEYQCKVIQIEQRFWVRRRCTICGLILRGHTWRFRPVIMRGFLFECCHGGSNI